MCDASRTGFAVVHSRSARVEHRIGRCRCHCRGAACCALFGVTLTPRFCLAVGAVHARWRRCGVNWRWDSSSILAGWSQNDDAVFGRSRKPMWSAGGCSCFLARAPSSEKAAVNRRTPHGLSPHRSFRPWRSATTLRRFLRAFLRCRSTARCRHCAFYVVIPRAELARGISLV